MVAILVSHSHWPLSEYGTPLILYICVPILFQKVNLKKVTLHYITLHYAGVPSGLLNCELNGFEKGIIGKLVGPV